MKKWISLVALMFISITVFAQKKLPKVELKNLEGQVIDVSSLENEGKPMVISFWATWCKPCAKELDAIMEVYEEWQEETGVEIYAVSIDDSRAVRRVGPYANGKGWEYNILLDTNGELKRALNVGAIPHTFLIDGEGSIVWQHTSYQEGDEEELFEEIENLVK